MPVASSLGDNRVPPRREEVRVDVPVVAVSEHADHASHAEWASRACTLLTCVFLVGAGIGLGVWTAL